MKVLVTGGAGFIGSHVVEELLENDYEVIVVDNLSTGEVRNLPDHTQLYQMDLNDNKLEDIFQNEKPDYVIHLAAQASVTMSMKDPYTDFLTNSAGTVKLIMLAKKHQVKKFVFASTAAIYGNPKYTPVDESHSADTLSYYALSKYTAESYLKFNEGLNHMESCILRFSNVYGPRQNASGESGVISIFIKNLLAGENITIYDGTKTRDFVYVKDVAYACRLALESDRVGVFNISTNTETSINELFRVVVSEMGLPKKVLYEPIRENEIRKSVLDNQKARNDLNWQIRYSLLEGITKTIKFHTKQLN